MKSGETEAELRENKRSVKGMFRSALDGNLRMSVDLPELLKGNIVVGGLTNFPLRPDDDEIVSDDVVSKYIGLDGVCSGAELVAASHTIQSDYVAWYYGRMNATERAQYVINECNSKLKVLTRRIAELRQEYESTQDPQKQFNLLANIRELEGVNGIIYFENTRSAAEQQLTTETATEPSREL
jgi:predicted ribosome quality control (RQC) complex YloA/Tae2 family protein